MKVYVCYDRYEHDEWYSVYSVGTDRDKMIKKCKEEDLPSFIEYGPDDCHSFQLVCIDITRSQYNKLKKWVDEIGYIEDYEDDENRDFYEFMYKVYDDEYTIETIISTDGCSDVFEIVKYYGVMYKNVDLEDVSDIDWYYSDECEDYQDELTNDEDLWRKVLREYVLDTY
jgi:hypothetical protein